MYIRDLRFILEVKQMGFIGRLEVRGGLKFGLYLV